MYKTILAVVGAIFLAFAIGVPWYFGMLVVIGTVKDCLAILAEEVSEDEDLNGPPHH